MKRILLIMAIAFISVIANAQDITISGITLGATKNEVIKILNEKKYQYQIAGNTFLVSPYTNKLSTAIEKMLIEFNSDNIVNNIMLIAADADIKILDDYDDIVSKLKVKYGEPFVAEEKYYSPYSENYRDYPLSAIKFIDKHFAGWEINNLILDTYIYKGVLCVRYSDTRYQEKETTNDY